MYHHSTGAPRRGSLDGAVVVVRSSSGRWRYQVAETAKCFPTPIIASPTSTPSSPRAMSSPSPSSSPTASVSRRSSTPGIKALLLPKRTSLPLAAPAMAADPYFEVKAEVESALLTASSLHGSYLRILRTLPSASHTSSEELSYALSELKATLSSLEADVEELDEAVGALEADASLASRLGVGRDEVGKRRAWVEDVKRQVDRMRAEAREPGSKTPLPHGLGSARSQGSGGRFASPAGSPHAPYRDAPVDLEASPLGGGGGAEDVEEFEMEHQTVRSLDSIPTRRDKSPLTPCSSP